MKRKAKRDKLRDEMDSVGYIDGVAGRFARYLNAEYQRAWRRGRQERMVSYGAHG